EGLDFNSSPSTTVATAANAEDCIRSAARTAAFGRKAVAALRIQSVELSRVGRATASGDSIAGRGTRWVEGGFTTAGTPAARDIREVRIQKSRTRNGGVPRIPTAKRFSSMGFD